MSRTGTVLAFAVYLVMLVVVGLYARRRQQGFREWVTGGGAIPAWMLALSFLANFVSSNSFIGHSSKSWEVGLVWCVVGAMMVVACWISWTFFAPRFAAFAKEHAAETLPDFFRLRFRSEGVGKAAAALVLLATLFYVLAVMRGVALVVASGLGISYPAALLVVWAVVVAYCMLGGLWADVTTDVVQSSVLVVGAVALGAAVFFAEPIAVAGLAGPPAVSPAPLGLVIAVGAGGAVKLLADPKQVMVFYAFRDAAAARRFRVVGPLLLLVVYACLFPLGFLARRIVWELPGGELEALVPHLVFDRLILGVPFAIVFMIALLAASMSSLDSAFLVMASNAEKHVVAPALGGRASIVRTRLLLFGIATATLLLSLRPIGAIIELTTFSGAIAAAMLPGIIAGFSSRDIPPGAVVASLILGACGAVAAKVVPSGSPWVQDVFGAMVLGALPLLYPWKPGAAPSTA